MQWDRASDDPLLRRSQTRYCQSQLARFESIESRAASSSPWFGHKESSHVNTCAPVQSTLRSARLWRWTSLDDATQVAVRGVYHEKCIEIALIPEKGLESTQEGVAMLVHRPGLACLFSTLASALAAARVLSYVILPLSGTCDLHFLDVRQRD